MNKKQVPEEMPDIYKIEADLRDFFTKNKEGKGAGYALRVLKRLFDDGRNAPISASLPAEPSTPETKDKPATGSGGGGEDFLKERGLVEMIPAHFKDEFITAMEEYATLHQPVGTVKGYIEVNCVENPPKDGTWHMVKGYGECIYRNGKWQYIQGDGDQVTFYPHTYLKPIQFLPEREGDAVRFAEWIRKTFTEGNIGIGDQYDFSGRVQTSEQLYQLFLQSTGEGINE